MGGKVCAHIYKVSTFSIYLKKIPPNGGVRENKKEQRAKEQEYKGLLSPRRTTTYNPKTNTAAVVVEEAVEAAKSRTAIIRNVVPRTTAQQFTIASTNQSTFIYRRVYIIFLPIIFAPF